MNDEDKEVKLLEKASKVSPAEEVEQNEDIETHILKKPIMFEGEKIERLVLDFDSLTAKNLMAAEREAKLRLGKKERLNLPKELDDRYTACVAARAAKVKAELFFEMGAKDFATINMLTMGFLLGGESSEEMED